MEKRKITVEDFTSFKLIGSLAASPDGQQVIFEYQTASLKEDAYRTQLMLADVRSQKTRLLTTAGKRNHNVQWSPDGKQIAFISDRAMGSQIWLIPADGGEAVQLTRFQNGVQSPRWSSDGSTIFALVPTQADDEVLCFADDTSETEAKDTMDKAQKEWAENPKRFGKLHYKMDGSGLSKHLYPQLVAIDVADGTVKQLTKGHVGIRSITPSPDGQYVYFTQGHESDLEWWYSDLYRIAVDSEQIERLSDELLFHEVKFSPDGKTLAALAYDDTYNTYKSATHTKLYLLTPEGQMIRHLTADFPDDLSNSNLTDLRASVGSTYLRFAEDSQALYLLSTREGQSEILRFQTDGSTPQGEVVLGGKRDIYAYDFVGESQFVFAYATSTNPSRLAVAELGNGPFATRTYRGPTEPMNQVAATPFAPQNEQLLFAPNEALVESLNLVEPEPFWYQSANNWWVQGWVMRPTDFQAGNQYPTILEIHGGPQLNYGYAVFHEMQWLAAQGYAIVLTNPRGGKSYGQDFVNAVRHHYGEGDAADVLNGLEAACEQFDFIDAKRVAVTGGSYGGFMTNWLVGHTNRFFAAVSQRSISNWISFFGCSDIGPLFVESQLVEAASGNLEALWRMSPLAYVEQVETPILMLHSEQDLRCPIEQAEQFYTWLRRRGKDTELLRIPNASHGLSRDGKPKLRVKRLEAIFGYINDRLPQA